MKYLLSYLFIFISALFVLPINQKMYKVTYKIRRVEDKSRDTYSNNYKSNKNLAEVSDHVAVVASDFTYTLYFNSQESSYTMDDYTPDETINDWYYSLALFVGGKGIYYQNKPKAMAMQQKFDNMSDDFIRIKDTLYKPWSITNEAKTIQQHKVVKATYNDFEVWFAPDIPVPFGPKGLGGLPGLILEASDGHFDVYVDKIDLDKSNYVIKMPTKGKIMSAVEKQVRDNRLMFHSTKKYTH